MRNSIREYSKPLSWETAHESLARTDLIPEPLFNSPRPVSLENCQAESVVDLSGLDLHSMREQFGALHLGSLVTLQELVESPFVRYLFGGVLWQAAKRTASLGLRNFANLGGVLNDIEAASELVLALLILDSHILVRRRAGETSVFNMAEWIDGRASLASGDILSEVQIDLNQDGGFALERVSRTPCDHPIVAVAARLQLQRDRVSQVKLAISGVSSRIQRLTQVEDFLEGLQLSPNAISQAAAMAEEDARHLSNSVSDYLGSAAYRQAMAGVLTRRAFTSAWAQLTSPSIETEKGA